MNQNIAEATGAALILCQVARQVVFHLDDPELSPPVITDGTRWPALSDGAGAALASHGLTKTADPDTATPAAIGIGKKIKPRTTNGRSNCTTQTTRKH